ncbi:hypothetical protein AB0O82_20735 [Kitasatospora sp. NPDC088264]|uniref:hypothetical protein n=1 Tax=unclassified Kitasatospora TaxID=2633591 RepID=UPI0034371381
MANDQSETPVASAPENAATTDVPAVAVEAGEAVEGAVAASSNTTEYTAPSDAQKAAIENDLFGDEAAHVVEPVAPATGGPGKRYEPEGMISGHP